ncbi:MAG: hypothetical protein J5932_06020, partial [Prevotella sp.]|nr:hypothetical protein [Prevotella sp.]
AHTAPVPCDTKSLLDEALKTDPKVERRQGDVAKLIRILNKTKENAKKSNMKKINIRGMSP